MLPPKIPSLKDKHLAAAAAQPKRKAPRKRKVAVKKVAKKVTTKSVRKSKK